MQGFFLCAEGSKGLCRAVPVELGKAGNSNRARADTGGLAGVDDAEEGLRRCSPHGRAGAGGPHVAAGTVVAERLRESLCSSPDKRVVLHAKALCAQRDHAVQDPLHRVPPVV